MEQEGEKHESRHWRIALAITLFLFVDGFDLFLLGKIAPAIAESFNREPAQMDLVFTYHQIGLAIGAFTVPVLADRWGSLRVLVTTAILFGLGNLASAYVSDFMIFSLLRGLCGIFMAGAMPVGLALLSEHVPKARLGAILSIAMVGMSVGAAANSVVPAFMMDRFGWESGFILGGLMPLALIPILLIHVPESQRFKERGAAPTAVRPGILSQLAPLFSDQRAVMTLLLWSTVSLSMGATALIAAWLPTFFLELGGIPIQDFAIVTTLTAIGGAAGTLAVGWLQDRYGQFLVTALAHCGQGIGFMLLGLVPFGTIWFPAAFLVWSVMQSASITGINLLLVRLYPVEVRATGAGWAAGMGRISGAMAPAIGTMILLANTSLATAMAWVAVPIFVIAFVVIPLLARSRGLPGRTAADVAAGACAE